MKKLILIFAVILACSATAMAQTKFGIVNPETIMRDLPSMKKAQASLMLAAQRYQNEDSLLKQDIQKKYDDFQKLQNDPNVLASIKERRMQELQDMTNKLQQFTQQANQDMAKQQEELMAPIQGRLVDAIRKVGADGGYTFIFTNEAPVYMGTDVVDVTDTVKNLLIEQEKKDEKK